MIVVCKAGSPKKCEKIEEAPNFQRGESLFVFVAPEKTIEKLGIINITDLTSQPIEG